MERHYELLYENININWIISISFTNACFSRQRHVSHQEIFNLHFSIQETGLQKLGTRLWACTYRAPKTSIRYTKKRAPKLNSNVCVLPRVWTAAQVEYVICPELTPCWSWQTSETDEKRNLPVTKLGPHFLYKWNACKEARVVNLKLVFTD